MQRAIPEFSTAAPRGFVRYTAATFSIPHEVFRELMATTAEGRPVTENSSSEFQSLEEKIYRTIELLREARAQKAAVELELATVRESFEAQAAENESLREQLDSLREDRNTVRSRVEKLLGDVDAILEQP
jgi:chromosome segregation ATPase